MKVPGNVWINFRNLTYSQENKKPY